MKYIYIYRLGIVQNESLRLGSTSNYPTDTVQYTSCNMSKLSCISSKYNWTPTFKVIRHHKLEQRVPVWLLVNELTYFPLLLLLLYVKLISANDYTNLFGRKTFVSGFQVYSSEWNPINLPLDSNNAEISLRLNIPKSNTD
uniref:Uncharacterized protein n=1 Tax=Trichobilharzia regenti TaxID=157069 RepID=A0AA85K1G9_TRIRE|nr:unnamed protein product [Trichobilharzia regenti]